jgi:CTP:molybdopterin cytidylyltransferase MocA
MRVFNILVAVDRPQVTLDTINEVLEAARAQ